MAQLGRASWACLLYLPLCSACAMKEHASDLEGLLQG